MTNLKTALCSDLGITPNLVNARRYTKVRYQVWFSSSLDDRLPEIKQWLEANRKKYGYKNWNLMSVQPDTKPKIKNPKQSLCKALGISPKLVSVTKGSYRSWDVELDNSILDRTQEVYDWLLEHREEYDIGYFQETNDYGQSDDFYTLSVNFRGCYRLIKVADDPELVRQREERERRYSASLAEEERNLASLIELFPDVRVDVTLFSNLLRTYGMSTVARTLRCQPDVPPEKINWEEEGF